MQIFSDLHECSKTPLARVGWVSRSEWILMFGQSYCHYNIQSYGNASRGDSFHWRSKLPFELRRICIEMLVRDCSSKPEQGRVVESSFKLQVNKADSNTPRHGHGQGLGVELWTCWEQEAQRIEARRDETRRSQRQQPTGREHKVNVQTFIYVLAMEYFKALQLPWFPHTHSPTASRCLCVESKRKLRCSVTQTNALRVDVGQRLQMTPGEWASPAASLNVALPIPLSLPLSFLSACLSVRLFCQFKFPKFVGNLQLDFCPEWNLEQPAGALICQPSRADSTGRLAACVAHVVNPIQSWRHASLAAKPAAALLHFHSNRKWN